MLSFLPSNNMEDAPLVSCSDDIPRQVEVLQTVIPEDPNMPHDIKDIIEPVLDNQYFFEAVSYTHLVGNQKQSPETSRDSIYTVAHIQDLSIAQPHEAIALLDTCLLYTSPAPRSWASFVHANSSLSVSTRPPFK